MHIDTVKLSSLLQAAIKRVCSAGDLAQLIHASRSIVQAHLETHRRSVVVLSLHHGLSLTDLAYDCIAEAFARTEDGRFVQLENFNASLQSPIDQAPDMEVFLAFKGYLVRVADAQLSRLYAQADPAGARIHRNIRECAKTSTHLSLDKDFRGLVLRPTQCDCLDHLEAFPIEKLEASLLGHRNGTIPETLACLERLLAGQSEFRRSIPLLDLVGALKRILGAHLACDISDGDGFDRDAFSNADIQSIRDEVEFVVKEKILLTYLARGKADRQQAEAMANAMHDLIEGLCSGDHKRSLFEYLRVHWPLTEQEYEHQVRSKMEYLMRIARDEFAARLMKEL